MVAYSSFQTGLWSSSSTWTPTGVPGDGDTAAIFHAVTVAAEVTVGRSAGTGLTGTGTVGNGSADDTPLAGASTAFVTELRVGDILTIGSARVVVAAIADATHLTMATNHGFANGSAFTYTPAALSLHGSNARLIVNAPLTLRGALVFNAPAVGASLTDVLTVGPGAGIEFDSSATTPTTVQYPWLRLSAVGQKNRSVFAGESGNRSYLRSNAGGGPAWSTLADWYQGGYLNFSYTDITMMGDSSQYAFDYDTSQAGAELVLDHCLVDTCGQLLYNWGTPAHAQATLSLLNTTELNSVGSYFGRLFTGPTSLIKGCVFEKPFSGSLAGATIGGTDPADWNLLAGYWDLSGSWTLFQNNLVRCINNQGAGSVGTIRDTYWLMDTTASNPHHIICGSGASHDFEGIIFEYVGTDVGGDCLSIGSQEYSVKNCIKLPNGDGGSAGTLISCSSVSTTRLVIEHNTMHGGGSYDSSGVRIGETQQALTGLITSFRANLYWDVTVRGFKICTTGYGAQEDAVASADADYNGGYRFAVGSNGKGYDGLTFSAGAPGAHDVEADPQFVWQALGLDPAAGELGMAGWDASLGGPGTVAHALAELRKKNDDSGYNGNYNVPDLIAWVRAIHRPTNPVYAYTTYPSDPATVDAAGNDLVGTVGAMAYLQPVSDYTVMGPAVGLPGLASSDFTVMLALGVNPGTVTITPALAGLTGTFAPTTIELSDSTRSGTFTLTPDRDTPAATVGSISVTNSGTLANPAEVTYTMVYPDLTSLEAWESHIYPRGQIYPRGPTLNAGGYDQYDVPRVMRNVQDYMAAYPNLGDPGDWAPQLAAAIEHYRDMYVLPNGGAASSYLSNNWGLAWDYERSGDLASRAAAILLRRYTSGYSDTRPVADYWAPSQGREVAYLLLNHIGAENVGYSPVAYTHEVAGKVLDLLNLFQLNPERYFDVNQPYMGGLLCEALIAYWDRYQTHPSCPAGIPAGIKRFLDWCWDNVWVGDDTTGAFLYTSKETIGFSLTQASAVAASPTPTGSACAGAATLPAIDHYFEGGLYDTTITFTSGALTGNTYGVSSYLGSTRLFTLKGTMSPVPAVGDTFSISYRECFPGTITAVDESTPNIKFNGDSGLSEVDDYYKYAEIAFTSGERNGDYQGIMGYTGSSREFLIEAKSVPYGTTLAPGDTFLIRSPAGWIGNYAPSPADNPFLGPAYAWYYQDTVRQGVRDNTYRLRYDAVFQGGEGVSGAWDNDRAWNVAYRWEFQGLKWRSYGDSPWPAATALTLTALDSPTGRANAWSGRFRVALSGMDVAVSGPVTITPSDGGAGGSFSPALLVLTTDRPAATFRYRPAATAAGALFLSITNDGDLSNPAAVTYQVSGAAADATGYTVAGPHYGPVGAPSRPFTLSLVPAGSVPGPDLDATGGLVTIAPADGDYWHTRFTGTEFGIVGGAFAFSLSGDDPETTFVYTAPAPGTNTITFTNDSSFTDVADLDYTVPDPTALKNVLRLGTAAGVTTIRIGH